MIVTGGQPITKNIVECIGSVCQSLTVAYGGTELGPVSAGTLSDRSAFEDFFCGKIIPWVKVKIVDTDGKSLPINNVGEIYLQTPFLFDRYFNDDEKTRSSFSKDAWFKTDDMGLVNDKQELFVYGRKSSMIISGGMNVTPEIMEKVLCSCPGVDDCVVVPVRDPAYYQVLCAVVVKKSSSLTEDQVRKFCEEYHNDKPRLFTVLPKYYMFLDKLPLTYTGKIARKKVTELAESTFCQNI